MIEREPLDWNLLAQKLQKVHELHTAEAGREVLTHPKEKQWTQKKGKFVRNNQ